MNLQHLFLQDLAEAAIALGVSPGTLKAARLHRLQTNPLRDLPHVRIGRSVRYRRADIEAWIDAHTTHPAEVSA